MKTLEIEMLVQINGLQSEVMEILLTFLYTAKTKIDQSNVQMLLEAANLFQIDLLRRVSPSDLILTN